ncbi:hypothetical protein ACWC4D_39990 [Streptomyces sp. NPDC001288]|uniref:hypothetical protein n=1 Tax=Streptomyces sp. NPDC001297 TaxID=3364559 RepID=UPI0036B99699
MPALKRPELPEGPKKQLNAALHDLHFRAGLPSVRTLVDRIGGDAVAGRSRIHDAFTGQRVADWGLIQVLVEALARTIPGADSNTDERRLHKLWMAASGEVDTNGSGPVTFKASAPAERNHGPGRPLLAMRLEWAHPGLMDLETRRRIRGILRTALDDIGQPNQGRHREDSSAGATITLECRHERPGLTVATFLAAVDDDVRQLIPRDPWAAPVRLRFLAHFDAAVTAAQVMADLNAYWTTPELDEHWQETNGRKTRFGPRVAAIVHGINLMASEDFTGKWQEFSLATEGGQGSGGFWLRTQRPAPNGDPWSTPSDD